MDLDKVKAFCKVVKHGSLTAAAEGLHLTVSGVKKQVNSLEEVLGHKLFNTIHQRLVLTEKGEVFYQYALRLLGIYIDAQDALSAKDYALGGRFVVSTTSGIVNTWFIEDIAEFVRKHEEFSMVVIGDDDELDLCVREADVAIRPKMEKNSDQLIQKFLKRFEVNLYASESYIEKCGQPKNVENLADHKLIGFADHHTLPYRHINWHLDYIPGRKNFNFSVNSGAGLLRAIENGLGIGPTTLEGAKMAKRKLVKVLPELNGPPVDIYYIYPKVLEDSKKVHLFYKYLINKFNSQEDKS